MAQRSVVVSLRAEVEGFRRGLNSAADAADQASRRFEGMSKAGAGLAAIGATLAVGVGVAVKAYAEFDAQMSRVQSATHATGSEMNQLREAAVKAGADTAFSAKEAAQGIEELSKAGVGTADILGGGLSGALALAAAGELSVADAAETAATALTQFKLRGDQIPHVADLLAAGAGKAQGSVKDMGDALKQGGLVASQYGLSIEETVGGLAAFASAGLTGSDAGTSFKTMLQRLTPTSKEAAAKMEELGFTAFDANGDLKSLSDIAGNLQQSMRGMDAESRNAAMGVIFGSDAVRAASVLYEQGAEGITKWVGSVNEAGYAAQTAAMQQDNLKGDIEKLTGSIDSVFLKSGSGMNDMLRQIAQGAEGLVDMIGQIPQPMLATATSITGMVAGIGILGGALLLGIPKVMEARAGWNNFAQSNGRLAGALSKTAKAAGIALGALAALQIVGAVMKSFETGRKTTEDFNQALLKVDKSSLDEAFKMETGAFVTQINGAGDALNRLGEADWYDKLSIEFGKLTGLPQFINTVQENVDKMDTSLSNLVDNGGLTRAGAAFKIMAEEADASAKANGKVGMSSSDVLKLMPAYTASLKEQATALGVQATEAELLELAYGRVPPRLQALAEANGKTADLQKIQSTASEDQQKALEEVGLAADGTVASLSKLIESFISAGLIQLSENEALRGYQETLAAFNKTLAENARTLDITTEAGRNNQEALDAIAGAGLRVIDSMAKNGASQDVLHGKLDTTYKDLINAYGAFGITGGAADELARKALGIPKGVPIEIAIKQFAESMAQLNGVEQKAAALKGMKVPIVVDISVNNAGALDPGQYAAAQRAASRDGRSRAFADGGIVTAYADGGVHVAAANGLRRESMIAKGGAMITWAEPETGWEAYISGKPTMRGRNRAILETIAPRFGLETRPAGSGAGPYGGGGNVFTQTNNIHEAVSPVHTALEVGRRMQMLAS